MTIQTPATRSSAPVRGVAVPLPTRREGPAKLTGQALYADDLVFPGAWYGATIRSTVPHARLLAIELDPGLRLVAGRRRHRGRHPGPERRREHRGGPADPRPGRRRDPPPGRAGRPARGGRPRHAPRGPKRGSRSGRRRSRPSSSRSTSTTVFAHHELLKGDVDAALAEAGLEVVEATYRVGHQEQLYIENNAMIAVPARGRRDDRPRQPPVPVLRAQGAQARASASTTPTPRSSRRRPAAGSAGKEEYPSMIALHAALLARKTGRPVRMIYDRHEDLAATTKRHPAIDPVPDRRDPARRDDRRPGHRPRHGRRRVHDAHAGRAVARDDPRRRPVRRRRTSGSGRAPWPPTRRPTARSAASGRPQVEFAAETQVSTGSPRRSGCRRSRSGAATPTGPAAMTPTNQLLRERRGRRSRSSTARPRRASSSGSGRGRRRPGAAREPARDRTARGHRARAGLARGGVHRLGRGEDGLDREPRADAPTAGSGS